MSSLVESYISDKILQENSELCTISVTELRPKFFYLKPTYEVRIYDNKKSLEFDFDYICSKIKNQFKNFDFEFTFIKDCKQCRLKCIEGIKNDFRR